MVYSAESRVQDQFGKLITGGVSHWPLHKLSVQSKPWTVDRRTATIRSGRGPSAVVRWQAGAWVSHWVARTCTVHDHKPGLVFTCPELPPSIHTSRERV